MISLWNPAFQLALASGSGARRRLLESAGLPFVVVPANVDERALEARARDASPADLALLLAKAKALSAHAPGALAVGADQTLSLDGRIFHKAPNRIEARTTLAALAGRTHRLISAFAIVRDGEILAAGADRADMTMRALGPEALDLYLDVAGESVLSSVGVYHWEGIGAHLFERVEGDYATILGLPRLMLIAALRRLGALRI